MASLKTVLVVDDDKECVNSLRALLEDEDCKFNVLCAGSGKEALKILEGQQVDALLADYRMPGMTGLDLLLKVKSDRPEVARFLMTAYPDFDVAMRAINEVGVRAFLPKPREPTQLCSRVHEALVA